MCWEFLVLAELHSLFQKKVLPYLTSQSPVSSFEYHLLQNLHSHPLYPMSSYICGDICVCSLRRLALLLQRIFFFVCVCALLQFGSHSYVGGSAYPYTRFCSLCGW